MKLIAVKPTAPAALVVLFLFSLAVPVVRASQKPATTQPGSSTTPAAPTKNPATAAPAFDETAKQAAEARDSGKLEHAIALYRKAVAQKPEWSEGWWYLGTLLYDLDRYAEAAEALKNLAKLEPNGGAGLALLGLCQFQTGEYKDALTHLERGRQKGLGGNQQLGYVARYHSAILFNKYGQFEAAFQILNGLAMENPDSNRITEGLGISALRLPYLPSELTEDKRTPVMMAGRAMAFHIGHKFEESTKEFESLLEQFGTMANVHYARGVVLLHDEPDAALEEFKKELQVSPSHVEARLQLAFEYIKRGEHAAGLVYAKEAVQLDPESFVARNALGRTLLDTGDVPGAVRELEIGVKLAPDSPEMQFALVRAYMKAGRKEDAQKARAEFLKLDKIRRERRELLAPGKGVQVPENAEKVEP